MSNLSGLQIDPRCIKCGKPPTLNGPLLEMQNHRYICSHCRQMEESKGKRISWADEGTRAPAQMGGQMMQVMNNAPSLQTLSLPDQSVSVPKNSLFGILEVPPTASQEDVERAIEEKMRVLMRNADGSDEYMQRMEQLREWQEALVSDPAFLQKQVDKVRPRKPRGSALVLAGQSVYSAQELLTACEASKQGWEDAETLLQRGELQPWILYQVGNRMVANEVDKLVQANVPMHRALNYVLYRLVPERPFRFYSRESWQAVSSITSAETPNELATCCDQNWTSGEWHLYNGAMIAWLEFSQGCKELGQYYAASLKPYAEDRSKRGLGLELVLERVAPAITRPKLVVAFDGIQDNSYILEGWDREISHLPVAVQINNSTRGFFSLTLEIVENKQKSQTMEPDWIYLTASRSAQSYSPATSVQNQPIVVYGRNGAGIPAQREITLTNLAQLKRGRRYERMLRVLEHREYGGEPIVHDYPVVLKTMSYFQGFRGLLWRCGLRGDVPGLVENALLGMLLAFLSSQLLLQNIHIPYSVWYTQTLQGLDFMSFLKVSLIGFLVELQQLPRTNFVQATGVIVGIVGLFTGWGKGHTSYGEKEGVRGFSKGAFWLSALFFPVLLFLVDGYRTLQSAFSYGGSYNVFAAISSTCGSLLLCCLIFLLACIVALLRAGLEKILRKRCAALLTPQGRA